MIYFVTGNQRKYTEAKDYVPELQQYTPQEDIPEIQSLDPKEIIAHKLQVIRPKLSDPYIVEDTSLHFHALNDFPGPYIKHMLHALGVQGIAQLMHPYEDTSVTAVCTIWYRDGTQAHYVQWKCKGTLCTDPTMLVDGFGRDPLFVPAGYQKSFARMSVEEKQVISHRTQAMKKLAALVYNPPSDV